MRAQDWTTTGARYYDASMGQFTSADTVKDDDGLDRYGYVKGNPETHNDPSGHCWIVCAVIAGAVVGAIVGAVSVVQAAQSGTLTGGTWARAVADVGLGAAAGAALAVDPAGAVVGLAGALSGLALGKANGGSVDLESGFEQVAIGTAAGGFSGGATDLVSGASFGEQAFAQGALQGGINAVADGASQLVGQLGNGKPLTFNPTEFVVAGITGSGLSLPGSLVRWIGRTSRATQALAGVLDDGFQGVGSFGWGGFWGSRAGQQLQSSSSIGHDDTLFPTVRGHGAIY
jgi:hypothetical protein